MPIMFIKNLVCVIIFIFSGLLIGEENIEAEAPPEQKPIVVKQETKGEEKVTETDSSFRSHHIYPSNWGQAGIFRVRSAESLPKGALTFGLGGEYYSISNSPFARGSTNARTIAEHIFIGYGK